MPQAPTLIAGRYRLGDQLGQGGMGRVWHARDEVLQREVAVKEILLPDELLAKERDAAHRRTLREARAAARLGHPNVVQVFDVLEVDGRTWIVMAYVPSRSLQEVLRDEGPLDPRRAARIGLDLLAALRAAHRAGVDHRDVKPANVLITDDGGVLLTDFGIATIEGDGSISSSDMLLGSPEYMSPERARYGTAGLASDLWSLGATLYAAVEGRSPFHRGSALATLTALAADEPDPPRQAGELTPLLTGLLRKDPATRIGAAEAEHLLRTAATGAYGHALVPVPEVRAEPAPAEPGSEPRSVPPDPPAAPAPRAAGTIPAPRSPEPSRAGAAGRAAVAAAGAAVAAGPAAQPDVAAEGDAPAEPQAAVEPDAPGGPRAAGEPHAADGPHATGEPHAADEPHAVADSDASDEPGGLVEASPAAPAGASAPVPADTSAPGTAEASTSLPDPAPASARALAVPDSPAGPRAPAEPGTSAEPGTAAEPGGAAEAPPAVSAATSAPAPAGTSAPAPADTSAPALAAAPTPAPAPVQAVAPAGPAAPPTSRPVPATVPGNPARSAGGGRRRLLATAAVVVVLIAAAVVWAVTRTGSDPGGGDTSAGAPATSAAVPPAGATSGADPSAGDPSAGNPQAGGPGAGSPPSTGASSAPPSAAAPTPPPRTSTGGALPARPSGWIDYRDPTGFALYVPRGWTRSKEGNIVYFRSRGRVLGIDQTRKPARNPVSDWRGKAEYRVGRGDFPSYREIHIKKVDYFRNAADWEFTFNRGGVRQHVNNRGLITADDQAYGIYWQTRDADWDRYRDDLDLVFDSFRPARRD